jgi:putative transposase
MITRSSLPVQNVCTEVDLSKSAYYKWKSGGFIQPDDESLLAEIRNIASEFSRYGYKRMTKELHRREFVVNHKRVYRIMKQRGLLVKRKRTTPKTTDSKHSLRRYPNLAKELQERRINEVWVADITYVRVDNMYTYLALIMDRYSRRIVGWELSRNVDSTLTLTALKRAVKKRGKQNVSGCIHHSDHGVQYLCNAYIQALKELGMLPSMGEVGNSYDNAHAESLNKTIKNEEVWINEYETFDQAYESIARFVKKYNEKRIHSSIGYVPPDEFEQQQLNRSVVS